MFKNFFFFFLLSLIACGPATRQKRIQRTFEMANTKLEQAYYDEAVQLYSQVISKDSEITDAFMNRGVAYFESGHYALALADYNHVYFNYPEYPEVIFNLAYCHLELERYPQAQEDLNQLKSLYPDSSLVDVIEGLFWTKQLELNKAVMSFSAAIDKDKYNFDAWTNRGIVQHHLGNHEEAKSDLLVSLTINQNAPEALNPLSLVYASLGELDKADSVINEALKIMPNQPYYINNLGYVKLLEGHFAFADSLVHASLTMDDQNGWAYKNLGLLALKQENTALAISCFEMSLQLDSALLTSYDALVELYKKRGKKDRADKILTLKMNYLPK